MSSWWNKEYDFGGEKQTPTQYLIANYKHLKDGEIAVNLTYHCERSVTKNAVKKHRQQLELFKDRLQKDVQVDVVDETFNEFEVVNNYGNAKAKTSNLADLIKECNIDTSIWEVESFKTWQGYAKVDGEIVTIPLSSASFVRKVPVQITPTIQPMKSDLKFLPVDTNPFDDKPVQTALVFSDIHFGFMKSLRNAQLTPFHNRAVLDIILQVAWATQPDRIDILGDIFDFPEWSDKFLRSPEFYWTTQPSIIEAHYFFTKLRKACKSKITLHQGNHEKRMERAILTHLPAAYDLRPTSMLDKLPSLGVENLLELDSLGINYVGDYPNDYDMLGNSLELMHGKKALGPFRTVQDVAKNTQISTIFGHIHRLESASHTHWTGSTFNVVEAISVGCTCHIDGRVPGTSRRQQWQNGFVQIEYAEDFYGYNIVPVKREKCVCNSYVYESNLDAYEGDLMANYPDWNW